VKDGEMDEVYTFIGDKIQNLHADDCRPQNRFFAGLGVIWVRTHEAIQQMVDEVSKAKW
jgi:hypothetical protein